MALGMTDRPTDRHWKNSRRSHGNDADFNDRLKIARLADWSADSSLKSERYKRLTKNINKTPTETDIELPMKLSSIYGASSAC